MLKFLKIFPKSFVNHLILNHFANHLSHLNINPKIKIGP